MNMKKLCALLLIALCLGCAQAQEVPQAQLLRVEEKTWTRQALQDAFLGGRQVQWIEDEYGLEYKTPEITVYGQFMSITAGTGQVDFRSDKLNVADSLAIYKLDRAGTYTSGSLEGFTLEQALSMAKDTCAILGIEPGELLCYSAFDGQGLEAMRRQYILAYRQNTDFSRSAEERLLYSKFLADQLAQVPLPPQGYALRLAINYRGVPSQCPINHPRSLDGDAFYPNYLLCYVAKEGVLALESKSELYAVLEEKPAGTDQSISQAQAQAKLNLDQDYTAAYEYVPTRIRNKTIVLQPAWVFYPKDGAYPTRINAFTGARIP